MANILQGELDAGSYRYGIIARRFNEIITKRLVDGAMDCLTRHGAANEQCEIIYCPGAFEIPLVAARAIELKKYDALICLGAVIRGDTPHFTYIASEVTKGVASLSLQSGIPISFGILTTDSMEQALERAGLKHGNKGWEAALSAIEMLNLFFAMGET